MNPSHPKSCSLVSWFKQFRAKDEGNAAIPALERVKSVELVKGVVPNKDMNVGQS